MATVPSICSVCGQELTDSWSVVLNGQAWCMDHAPQDKLEDAKQRAIKSHESWIYIQKLSLARAKKRT